MVEEYREGTLGWWLTQSGWWPVEVGEKFPRWMREGDAKQYTGAEARMEYLRAMWQRTRIKQ